MTCRTANILQDAASRIGTKSLTLTLPLLLQPASYERSSHSADNQRAYHGLEDARHRL